MITPYDIEKKEFSRSMRGFNADEVNDFLDEIIFSMQKLIHENENLKEKVQYLTHDLEKYRDSENAVAGTIESAKKLMNDISESAERRAEIIIRNAQLDAEMIQKDAKDSVVKLTEEGQKLKEKVGRYREKYRQLLEDELNQLDGSSEDLFAELEKEFMPASMDETAARTQHQAAAVTQPQEKLKIKAKPVSEPVSVSDKTMVFDGKSIEQILQENYGASDAASTSSKQTQADLTKTRIF